ncbi:MAG: tRNA (adenosine(37)-N6)-threonylcarbamoyltransferase complex transferase subunit TsaD [Myxococcota bacterium]
MEHETETYAAQYTPKDTWRLRLWVILLPTMTALTPVAASATGSDMRILGIESSCDDTAAAVVEASEQGQLRILSSVVHNQSSTHARFGGIVPEVASREHIARIEPLVSEALGVVGGPSGVDGIAVTRGPGLIGSLLVGLQFAKGFALSRGLPWIGINHLEGHLAAAMLAEDPPPHPHIAVVVSGGHTQLYLVQSFDDTRLLGGTRDDAAGEAFDKIAKILGLGYPGGPAIERAAQGGDPCAVSMPRGLPAKKLPEFSFSGLKTAAADYLRTCGGSLQGQPLADFCASVQEAICDIITKKAVVQAGLHGVGGVVLAGGVAANSRLRLLLNERCQEAGLWGFAPAKSLCTDNAAMIAAAGYMRLRSGQRTEFEEPARSRWSLGPKL